MATTEGTYECLPRVRSGNCAPSQSGHNAPILEGVVDGKKVYKIRNQTFEVDEHYQMIKAIGIGAYGLVCSALDLRRVPGSDFYDPKVDDEDKQRLATQKSTKKSWETLAAPVKKQLKERKEQAKMQQKLMKEDPSSQQNVPIVKSTPDAVLHPPTVMVSGSLEEDMPFVPSKLSNKLTSPYVAIKKVGKLFADLVDCKRVLRETVVLQQLRGHENILHVQDLIRPRQSQSNFKDLYIVTELLDTDLHCVIKSSQNFEPDHLKYLTYQMLKAMVYVHSAGVIHRDLKPGNMLLSESCDLKVCDFGLARGGVAIHDPNYFSLEAAEEAAANMSTVSMNSTEKLPTPPRANSPPPAEPLELTEYVITRYYRPPELLIMANYSHPVDMWSIGCIFAEMLVRRPVFPGKDYLHQLKLICAVDSLAGMPKEPEEVASCFTGGDQGQNYLREYVRQKKKLLNERAQQEASEEGGPPTTGSVTPPPAGRIPKVHHHSVEQCEKLRSQLFAKAPTRSTDIPILLVDLLGSLLCFNPNKRITALDALRHPYFGSMYTPEDEIAFTQPHSTMPNTNGKKTVNGDADEEKTPSKSTTAQAKVLDPALWEFDRRDLSEGDLRELFWGQMNEFQAGRK